MSRIIRGLFVLAGYVCVATVITLALILSYLWHTDHLNDEKVFRMVALLHDVDLEQIAHAQQKSGDEVPPEEPSLDDVLHHQHIQDRNFEVKLLALQQGRHEYDHRLQELKEKTDRYDRMAQDWQSKLAQQVELATQENVAKVVSQLEQVQPAVGKDMLLRWIAEGRMDDAILLMNRMSENKLAKILKKFETDEELDKLHEIHQRIISGAAGPSQKLQQALDELKGLESSGN